MAAQEYKKQSLMEVVKTAELYFELDSRSDNTNTDNTNTDNINKKDILTLVEKIKEIGNINESNSVILIDEELQEAIIVDKKTKVSINITLDENNNVKMESGIVEDLESITPPTITASTEPNDGTISPIVKITITAEGENTKIAKIQFPNNKERTYSNKKTVIETYSVSENGKYKFVVLGENGRRSIKIVEVKNAKGVAPITLTIENEEPAKDAVNILLEYDENPTNEGKILENEDRYQYRIGENGNWKIAAEYSYPISVTENVTVYARYYDGEEGFKVATQTVNMIDKQEPDPFELEVTATSDTITVSGKTTDKGSQETAKEHIGIKGYQFQLKDSTGKVLIDWTPSTPQKLAAEGNKETYTFTEEEHKVTDLTEYMVSMRALDLAGNLKEATNKDKRITTKRGLRVGDFVNYSVMVDSNNDDVIDPEAETYNKWRVLHKNTNGQIEIVCYNGPRLQIGEQSFSDNKTKSRDDYINYIDILNKASQPYKEGLYGDKARHLGSNPTKPDSYETILLEHVRFYDESEVDSSINKPTVNIEYLEQNHHELDVNSIKSFAGNQKLFGNNIFLGSRTIEAYAGMTMFNIRSINSSGDISVINFYMIQKGELIARECCIFFPCTSCFTKTRNNS